MLNSIRYYLIDGGMHLKRVFITLPSFWNDWIASGLTDTQLADLEGLLLREPEAGELIRETGGIRKVRFARPGKGKSSGVRVFLLGRKMERKAFFSCGNSEKRERKSFKIREE